MESLPTTRNSVGGGHLLADYAANGSTLIAHLRDRHIWEYPLWLQRTSAPSSS